VAKDESTNALAWDVTEAMLRLFNRVVQERRTAKSYGGEKLTMVEAQLCFMIAFGTDVHPSELADSAGVSRSAVSQVLTRLRERGYIESVRSDTDGRSQMLRVTESGQNAANGIQQVFEDMKSHVYDSSESDLRAFLTLFNRVDDYLVKTMGDER